MLTFAGALGACERRPEPTPPTPPSGQAAAPAAQESAPTTEARPLPPMLPIPEAAEGRFAMPGVSWEIPEGWEKVPAGGMRAAQLRAPGWSEERPNEMVLFYFGPTGAGGVDANLARWASMVVDAEGQPAVPQVDAMEADGMRVTLARVEGTYLDGPPGREKTPREGYVLLAAIYEGAPYGPAFLRFTGPREVIEAAGGAWRTMLESAKREAE